MTHSVSPSRGEWADNRGDKKALPPEGAPPAGAKFHPFPFTPTESVGKRYGSLSARFFLSPAGNPADLGALYQKCERKKGCGSVSSRARCLAVCVSSYPQRQH